VAYGSLKPGESNFHIVEDIAGEWIDGTIRGELGAWGPYLRLLLDTPNQQQLAVQVLLSAELPKHWGRLDAFEGEAYERVLCDVQTTTYGKLRGFVYAMPSAVASKQATP
jgi:gamma-glutamylcyclotransferase (GGCT)/AIG2-like uncharacterized protein YtfP